MIYPATLRNVNVPTEVMFGWAFLVTTIAEFADALTFAKLTSSSLNGMFPVALEKVYGTVLIYYPKIL